MGIPNRERFWVPQSLKYRFLAEAIRLWELERFRVDLVTVQAATLLNLVYSHNGMDKIGEIYLSHAIHKAQQLHLFGDHAMIDNERMFHARVFTAWALFNWQWYVCLVTSVLDHVLCICPLIRCSVSTTAYNRTTTFVLLWFHTRLPYRCPIQRGIRFGMGTSCSSTR